MLDLSNNLLMSQMSKEFSRKYILSQSINFTEFHQKVKYYNRRALQSLFIIVLSDLKDLREFSSAIKLYNTALHLWLIVFTKSQDVSFNQNCLSPRKNLFGLVVNSKVLVKCDEDEVIREWYSCDGIRLTVNDYGLWRYGQGLTKLTKEDFYERRSNLKGIRLKVSAVKVDFCNTHPTKRNQDVYIFLLSKFFKD